jgi:hypothetical protein
MIGAWECLQQTEEKLLREVVQLLSQQLLVLQRVLHPWRELVAHALVFVEWMENLRLA